jgi:hypothetical protein
MAHAETNPSAADRWFYCPGSVVLSRGMPRKESAHADEGTLAHSVAEALLTGKPVPAHPAEMDEHLSGYVQAVQSLCYGSDFKLHVEVKVQVTDEVWGTADAIIWCPSTRTLWVRDLKYGAGVGVEVGGNLQLKIYALAALLTMGYPADVVNVGIYQPRYNHPDGPSRSKDYDAVDLLEFHADLLEAVERVKEAEANEGFPDGEYWAARYLNPTTKGCRWCLAAPKCPKLQAMANETAAKVFAPELAYDPEQLSQTLDKLDLLEGWIKNCREFAYSEAEAGRTPPRYKLVEKRATRKWKDNVDYRDLLKALGTKDTRAIYKAPELLAVGDILKMCPGKNNDERALVLEPFVTKESSGHALVPESDKRPAVRLDAAAVFSEVSE